MKQIMDITGTTITLPPKDATDGTSTPITFDGESPNIEDEVLIPIIIYGSPESCEQAKARMEAIVTERAAKVVHSSRLSPQEFEAAFWPFVKRELGAKWAAEGVSVEKGLEGIEVKGEKEKVAQVAAEIKALHDTLVRGNTH